MKIYVPTKACTQRFIASLLIIAKNWKQPKSPSIHEWISKMQYIHVMEHYSAIKRNKPLIHTIWMNPKDIALSVGSQIQKITYIVITFK